MYISACMGRNGVSSWGGPSPKTVGNRGKTAKHSLWSLQCPALKCARQAPARQTSVYGRVVHFDQRCTSSGRPQYRRACQSSIQTEANRERNASRYFAPPSQAHSSNRSKAEVFDESARE